jgi:uncharacterized protein with von Willebrand factor type A (vWA) domain
MVKSKNDIILVLLDGVLDIFSEMIDYAEKVDSIINKAQNIGERLPSVDIKELKRQELEELYKKFAIATNNKERDEILKRVIELKAELEE